MGSHLPAKTTQATDSETNIQLPHSSETITARKNQHVRKPLRTTHPLATNSPIVLLLKAALVMVAVIHQLRPSQQACTTAQAPFPKIVGGTSSGTYIDQIDYNTVTGWLVAGGYTQDQGVRGDVLGSVSRPIFIGYQAPQHLYSWGKVFMSMASDTIRGVNINRLGTRVVVANWLYPLRYLIVIDIANGNVISATSVTTTISYDKYKRNLLLLDTGQIMMGEVTTIVYKIDPASPASSKQYELASSATAGLQTNAAQIYLHILSFSSPNCMLTVVDIATFTNVYQGQVQCASNSLIMGYYSTSATDDTIIFQEATKFYRIRNDYTTPAFTPTMVHDPANPSFTVKGLYCASNDLVYSLMEYIYSTSSSRLFVAEVNFVSLKITYRKYLQSTSDVYLGVIYEADKFFIVQQFASTLFTSASSSFSLGTDHGIIYSPLDTCQQVDQVAFPEVALTANTYSFATTATGYTETSLTVATVTVTPGDIVSSQFEGQFASTAQCGITVPVAPYDYTNLVSAQSQTTFYFATQETSKSFTIAAFTADKVVPTNADPVFAYTMKSFGASSSVSMSSPTTGAITIPTITTSDVGTFTFVVEGKLQDCLTATATFTIVGESNVAPTFNGIVGLLLPDQTVVQMATFDYTLPAVADQNTWQTVGITGTGFPTFAVFTDPTNTVIRMQPTLATAVGSYPATVTLNDGIATTMYTLNLIVTVYSNAPPVFNAIIGLALPDQTVAQLAVINYQLPAIVDTTGGASNTVTLSDSSGTAYPLFVDFTDSSHTVMRAQPTIETELATYPIIVTLNDGILSTIYTLNIIVTPMRQQTTIVVTNLGPPVFEGQLDLVTVEIGTQYIYTLPSFSDPNGDKISVTAILTEAILFTKFNNATLQFTFSPKADTTFKSNFLITVILTDDNIRSMSSKYDLNIVITGISYLASTSSTIPSQIEIELMKRNEKVYQCGIRIMQLTKTGMLSLKITSSNQLASQMIASSLNETDLDVRILRFSSQIQRLKIQDINEKGILSVQLGFSNIKEISSSIIDLDVLQVKIKSNLIQKVQLGYAILEKDIKAVTTVPPQLSENEIYYVQLLQKSKKIADTTILASFCLISTLFIVIMNLIWGMMNDLSYIISLSMISIPVPGLASTINSFLLQIIYMDLLMTDDWLTIFTQDQLFPQELDEDSPVNIFLDQQGFYSRLSVLNIGSTIIFLALEISLLVLVGIAFLLRNFSNLANKVYEFLGKRVLWAGTIRFVLQQFQPLLISSIINVSSTNLSSLSYASPMVKASFAISCFSILSLVTSMLCFAYIMNKFPVVDVEKKYSPLIEGIKNNNGFANHWTTVTIIKWSILCITLTMLADYPCQQIQIVILLSVFSTALQLKYKPQDSTIEQWISLFNEIMASLSVYVLVGLAIGSNDEDFNDLIAMVAIGVTLFSLAVNLGKVLFLVLVMIVKKIKMKCARNTALKPQPEALKYAISSQKQDQIQAASAGEVSHMPIQTRKGNLTVKRRRVQRIQNVNPAATQAGLSLLLNQAVRDYRQNSGSLVQGEWAFRK